MRLLTFSLTCFLIAQTVFVFGQTPPSVTDTIDLPFDTIQLPKRGPNFSNYYVSGQKLFGTLEYSGQYTAVYESLDRGATWRFMLDSLIDFHANDSTIIYCQYVYGAPISANTFAGYSASYKIFVSSDGGNSFVLRDSNYVQSFHNGRFYCNDDYDTYNKLRRLNDTVLIYGINKQCNIYNPTGIGRYPYVKISKDNGKTWLYDDNYKKLPRFVVDGTAFQIIDSFAKFTKSENFHYDDSIKLSPIVNQRSNMISGYSFIAGTFSIYESVNSGNGPTYVGVVYSTKDKGQTWQIDTLAFPLTSSNQVVQIKDTVFILSQYEALYRSINGSPSSFQRIYPQMPINRTKFSGLSVTASSIYLNSADEGLLHSLNGGNTWQKRNNNEGTINNISSLNAFGEDIWFYDRDALAVYHFEDTNSVSRVDILSRITPSFEYSSIAFRKDSLYLKNKYLEGMSRSLDKGLTWTDLPFSRFTPKLDSNSIYGVLDGTSKFVISNDNANTFSTHFAPNRLWDLVIKKNKIWAVIGDFEYDTKVIRSVDSGRTWVTIFSHSASHPLFKLAIEGDILWLSTIFWSNNWRGQIYKSTDDGTIWTQMSSGIDINSLYYSQFIRKKGYLFLYNGISGADMFISKNEGITWTHVNNTPNAFITDKYIYTSTLVLTPSHTYRLKISRFLIDSLASKIKSDKTYSLLRGQILKDNNANCLSDSTDTPFNAKMLRFNGLYNTATDQNGRFSIMLPVDTYKIEIANERYFALGCGSDTILKNIIVSPNTVTDTTLFFQKTKTVHDISLTLTPNGRPRPANELDCVLTLKNLGTEAVDSLQVLFDFSNMPVRFVSASPNAALNGQKLTWARRNFPPDAEEMLHVTLRIDTTAPLSTELRFYAQTEILNQIDAFPRDNRDSARLRIVGSFDPNDKSVLPDGKIPLSASLDTFDYLIRFQNTGTDTAYKVVVVDTLPELLDPYSVRVKAASSDYQLVVNKNTLIFTFDRIFLPDSFVNERASHGFIRFTISPKKTLSVGEKLDNRAHIFFDYNAAIMTNTAQNDVFKPSIQTEQTVKLCAGDRWQNTIYTRPTVRIDTLQGALIDTFRTTFLDVKPTYHIQIDTTLRLGDTLFGRSLKDDQKVILARQTVFSCDSTIVYNVHVLKPSKATDFDVSKINITVSPNPTNNWLSIYYNINSSLETEVYLVNSLGQKQRIIKSKSLDTEGGHTIRLDMSSFRIGIYQIILQTSNGVKAAVFSKI